MAAVTQVRILVPALVLFLFVVSSFVFKLRCFFFFSIFVSLLYSAKEQTITKEYDLTLQLAIVRFRMLTGHAICTTSDVINLIASRYYRKNHYLTKRDEGIPRSIARENRYRSNREAMSAISVFKSGNEFTLNKKKKKQQ